MATVTIEGSRNLVYVDLNVWEASYDIGSNTSNVSYSVVIRKGSKSWNTSWAGWGQKIYVSYSIHGHNYTTYIPTYNYNGQVPPGSTIASGTINSVGHNADGSLSIGFGISLTDNANGNNSGKYYTPGNASWKESSLSLTTIPRQANMTSAPDFNDEQNPTIGYSNPAGNSVSSLQACISLTGSAVDIGYRDISKTGSSYTFNLTEAERNVLRNACTTSNSRTVVFFVRTIIGSNTFYSTITKTLSITNASPTFSASNVSYKDNNSTTVGITGNNQKLVQNLSSLLVTITSATAKKGASITKYESTINGVTKTITSAGNIDYGVINSGSNLTLTVKVTDSRGNTNSCTKTVTFLPWVLPSGIITLKRKNNYENETYLKVQASYSSIDSKNTITIQYQFKKTTESSYSTLANLSNNTQITLQKDKASAWDFRIVIKDKFGTTTYNTILAKGQFIFFVDTKKLSVGVNCFPKNKESLEINGSPVLEYTEISSW